MKRGILIILSGPSGVGKDTLIDAWSAKDPSVVRVVACTTRQPREGEANGSDYHFLSEEEFHNKIEHDYFLEYKLVHGKYYGTPLDQVENLMAQGKSAILKIDVQGALEVIEKRPDALSIFILPPSNEELERRLTSRKTESEEQIKKRLETARKEIALAENYQYQIINDDIETALNHLDEIRNQAWSMLS